MWVIYRNINKLFEHAKIKYVFQYSRKKCCLKKKRIYLRWIFPKGFSSSFPSDLSADVSDLGIILALFSSCLTFISFNISPPNPFPPPRRTTPSPSASSGLLSSALSVFSGSPVKKLRRLAEKTSVSDRRAANGDGPGPSLSVVRFLAIFSWAT